MSETDSRPRPQSLNRRNALALLGTGGLVLAEGGSRAVADDTEEPAEVGALFPTVAAMSADGSPAVGTFVRTLGYHAPGDGGAAVYEVRPAHEDEPANGGDIIALANKKQALLRTNEPINYHQFGVVGDGKNDDGVQIKRAHEFARRNRLPIRHHAGEYWIIKANEIPITTNVQWGETVFHIDERYNTKDDSRFRVESRLSPQAIELDHQAKESFLAQLKPGVPVIEEMAPYKNCLVNIADENDQIGFRAGSPGQSWDREELFYVEQDGRIIGDIAWTFQDYTRLTAYPCDDHYLTISGGGFRLSGDNPGEEYTGYYENGFRIRRSRVVIRDQWVGLEEGARDTSMEPRSGFYSFSRVFDATLENIRLIPYVQNRSGSEHDVGAGTYGISGSRMLHCTFRDITAEGSQRHWGVFGTNLNKDFYIDRCRLNRVDVHFHCWNLTIRDSELGYRGITVTGGGTLDIQNTTGHGNSFINFRRDFGGKWDGPIRIRDCTLAPHRAWDVSLLYSQPDDFDYGYQIGCGRSIDVENFLFDFQAVPDEDDPCWLMNIASFSRAEKGGRLFFPRHIAFRNVRVRGRQQGARVVDIPDPYHYDLDESGGYDGAQLQANCRMIFDNVDLETLPAADPDDGSNAHLRLGGSAQSEHQDEYSLRPRIEFRNCENLHAHLGGCTAAASFDNCLIDRLTAAVEGPLRGGLAFNNCRFQPNVKPGDASIYALEAELGTRLTNTTLHAPRIEGEAQPEAADRIGFVQLNRLVRFFHLNTTLANDLLHHLRQAEVSLKPAFLAMLKSHHGLEPEQVPDGDSVA